MTMTTSNISLSSSKKSSGTGGEEEEGDAATATERNNEDEENNRNDDNNNDDHDDDDEVDGDDQEQHQHNIDDSEEGDDHDKTMTKGTASGGGRVGDDSDKDDDDDDSSLLGGTIDKDAYCLLDGFLTIEKSKEDSSSGGHDDEKKRITLVVENLPSTLGRTHAAADEMNFVPMGKYKALSRNHVSIEYRTPYGMLVSSRSNKKDNKLVFEKNASVVWNANVVADSKPIDDSGSYVITCLSKNRILVDGKRVGQNQSAVLHNGSTIKIAMYSLYFLLPKSSSSPNTMQVTHKSRVVSATSAAAASTTKTSSAGKQKNQTKKKKGPSPSPVLSSSSSASATKTTNKRGKGVVKIPPPNKKPKLAPSVVASMSSATDHGSGGGGGGYPTIQAEVDAMSTQALLNEISDAIETDTWERRHQIIGSTCTLRAVVDAAHDLKIQGKATLKGGGGVSRSEVMEWIATSKKYGHWVSQMLTKLEDKSYQASITKALIKAGFERTASSGRYIKWTLPKEVLRRLAKQGKPPNQKKKRGAPSLPTTSQKGKHGKSSGKTKKGTLSNKEEIDSDDDDDDAASQEASDDEEEDGAADGSANEEDVDEDDDEEEEEDDDDDDESAEEREGANDDGSSDSGDEEEEDDAGMKPSGDENDDDSDDAEGDDTATADKADGDVGVGGGDADAEDSDLERNADDEEPGDNDEDESIKAMSYHSSNEQDDDMSV